jgi:7,8-dihydroneopterin 2',3'-cyclic phosphate phosphodiesterase
LVNPRLERILKRIKDETLRGKVAEILENPTIRIGDEAFSGLALEDSPAALWQHHTYSGGLIEHIEATTEIAITLCRVIEKVYKGKVDRDVVLAGVLLHDVFKPLTYALQENGSVGSSPLGEKLDHLSLVVSELIRRNFPLEVVHTVCAHHGEYGPMKPKTLEALVCFLADYADSQLNGGVLRAAKHIAREATGGEIEGLTAREAFKIVHLKAAEGLEGVRKFLEKREGRI